MYSGRGVGGGGGVGGGVGLFGGGGGVGLRGGLWEKKYKLLYNEKYFSESPHYKV